MDKPKICVVIPWRYHDSRDRAYQLVLDWYSSNLPEAIIISVDYPGDVWLPSHTRNLGVRLAEESGADIVIMNDADTIPDGTKSLMQTVQDAMLDNFIHNPYTEYRFYNLENTDKYFETKSLINCNYRIEHGSNAGVWVFKPSSWWLLGGMDEKFVKWGYEDTALEYVHKIIHGKPLIKHKGIIIAFDHKRNQSLQAPDDDLINNFNRYQQYLSITNPKDMVEFIGL
jgi:predicted glycosyltransferase involved in capsule biosynthesis